MPSLDENIHFRMKTLINSIAEEHGILITDVSAEWISANTVNSKTPILKSVTITTKEEL